MPDNADAKPKTAICGNENPQGLGWWMLPLPASPTLRRRQANLEDEAGAERFFSDLGAFDHLVCLAGGVLLAYPFICQRSS